MSSRLARYLALAACITVVGTVAEAAPSRRAKLRKEAKVAPPVDDDAIEMDNEDNDDDDDDEDEDDEADEADEADAVEPRRKSKHRRAKPRREQVAATESDDLVDRPKVRKRGKRGKSGMRDWHFAIGPNVWAASVDASVSVGAKDVGTAIDFFQLSRNTRIGVPVLVEGRYKRFSVVADVLYGVVDVAGQNEVGPLMVTLQGTITNWLVDGMAGYRFLGDDNSYLTLEARGGVRYQRTAIQGSVGIGGNGISPSEIVMGGADLLAGARLSVRPKPWFFLGATADQSIAGSSTSTWSVAADANVRIGSRVLLSAGYRTLTQQTDTLSTVMHGPKVMFQLLF